MSYKMDGVEQERKLFVGGLNKVTDEDGLRQYFEGHGEIVDCTIMRDQDKRSRGFGFILFDDAATVDKIIASKKEGHAFSLDDHSIEIKRALPKVPRGSAGAPRGGGLYKKIFVGGLPSSISEEDVRHYFEAFGRVNEVQLIKDRETSRLRGFAFVTFDEEDSADKCLQRRTHEICKKLCEVKRAQTRSRDQERSGGSWGDRRPTESNRQAPDAAASGPLDINEVNKLIQQAFSMGQGAAYQPPSVQLPTVQSLTAQPPVNVLLQSLMAQQNAPAPIPAPVAAPAAPALSQIAQLIQASGIDTNALGSLLKQSEGERPPATAPSTSIDVYSGPYSYGAQSSSYGPSKDDYSSDKRSYRPY